VVSFHFSSCCCSCSSHALELLLESCSVFLSSLNEKRALHVLKKDFREKDYLI
jgi:hypothetical protein